MGSADSCTYLASDYTFASLAEGKVTWGLSALRCPEAQVFVFDLPVADFKWIQFVSTVPPACHCFVRVNKLLPLWCPKSRALFPMRLAEFEEDAN